MTHQEKNISIDTEELLGKIKKLEVENELLRLSLSENNSAIFKPENNNETVPVESMFNTNKKNNARDIHFLEQTSRIANVGGWEVDLINNNNSSM